MPCIWRGGLNVTILRQRKTWGFRSILIGPAAALAPRFRLLPTNDLSGFRSWPRGGHFLHFGWGKEGNLRVGADPIEPFTGDIQQEALLIPFVNVGENKNGCEQQSTEISYGISQTDSRGVSQHIDPNEHMAYRSQTPGWSVQTFIRTNKNLPESRLAPRRRKMEEGGTSFSLPILSVLFLFPFPAVGKFCSVRNPRICPNLL